MNKQQIAERAKRSSRVTKDDLLAKLCTGKTILDVGCVGQDRIFTSDNWLHNKIRRISQKIDGVDILIAEMNQLKQQGYSMFTPEELERSKNKYEVVLMSDVIEHVNDPVAFLKFYSQFLSENGIMFVSTPNSNRSNNFINILFNNNYSVNEEHTFWFCPRTFAEVVRRAGLEIHEFHWADHYFTTQQVKGFYQKLKFSLIDLLKKWRSNFNPNMIFIVKTNEHGC
jgi:2-polyprenyl-3-methyl-5-hydroxy-6-metoxy-1,4-benzoquinol methylase